MLTEEEQQFIEYWEKNRDKQKKFFKQLAIGLPMGVLFAVAIFVNLISGWYKRATMVFNANPSIKSLIIVLIIAVLLIVVFVSVFSVKLKWERNDQRYRELMFKKESDDSGFRA
jgi:peptidoglycan biosynthesis protein MviN/MurJ (putative lipid II flippase)